MNPTSLHFKRGTAASRARGAGPLVLGALTLSIALTAPGTASAADENRTCNGKAVTIYAGPVLADAAVNGSAGDDVIMAVGGRHNIFGDGGDDTICSITEAGRGDFIYGGAGDDFVQAGAGDDWIHGQDGIDILKGGAGDDDLLGGKSVGSGMVEIPSFFDIADQMYGEEGNDRLYGQADRDYLDGGAGDDFLDAGDDRDRLVGGTGNDALHGGPRGDFLDGDEGDDHLFGDDGLDNLHGGPGVDVLEGGDGSDELKGQDGNDRLYGNAGLDNLYGGNGSDYLNGNDGLLDTGDGGPDTDRCQQIKERRKTSCELT